MIKLLLKDFFLFNELRKAAVSVFVIEFFIFWLVKFGFK